jgi:ABC-type polysaccharide/polyol phosphate export permease
MTAADTSPVLTEAIPADRDRATFGGTPMFLRAFGYWALRYRRTWQGSIVISVANPLLFLIAIGAGLGKLISPDSETLNGVAYLTFFAPGMLAAASMQNGIVESAFPVSVARLGGGPYRVAAATPMEPTDILYGHVLFMTTRIAMSAAAFLAVMLLIDGVHSPLVTLTLPAAVLTGLAFATPVAAWAVTLPDPNPVGNLFKWVVMPLYLFSGTFFAIEQLPAVLRWLAYLSPLWHGVDLCRTLSLGTATWGMSLLHVAYLTALTVVGVLLCRRTYRRHLHE